MTTALPAGPMDPPVMRTDWVKYNPLMHTYDTPDGTMVSAELVDSAQCMADVLHIANIRAQQRKNMRHNAEMTNLLDFMNATKDTE